MTKTALVADNDVLFVEFLGELLEKRGYRVFKAFDGREAVNQMEQIAMDLFFVDIYMPKLDGREVIRQVRERFSPDEMKIIAVSGAAREAVEGLDELDFDAFLQKSPLEKMAKTVDLLMKSID
ncbi:MAG: response regulator [Desulfatiglandaceae bacterium]